MADTPNTMAVAPLAPAMMRFARSQTIATAMSLRTLQSVVLKYAGGGPSFPAGQDPVRDGATFTDSTGATFYRPQIAVADRGAGRRPGPDVWFLKDDDGVITMTWTLETVPMGEAVPLPFTVTSVTMDWAGGSKAFDAPGVTPVTEHGPDQPAYLIQGGAQLSATEAATLETAMNHPESACRLTVTYGYDYSMQVLSEQAETSKAEPPDTEPPQRRRWFKDAVVRDHRSKAEPPDTEPPQRRRWVKDAVVRDHRLTRMLGLRSEATRFMPIAEAVSPTFITAASLAPAIRREALVMRSRVSDHVLQQIVARPIGDLVAAAPARSEQRSATVVRTVPFVFEPSQEQNAPIYRSLHGRANLTGSWEHGQAGWVCDSVFPNTVNRLPDDIRLAWNPELRGPHMVPTLHRDDQGNPKVRLLLRLSPFQDPASKVLLRRLIGMPSATVVIGEVGSSTMHLGGSFPEELVVVGSAGEPAPLSGMDLTLELSLAYYQLFCQQISSPVGVPGQVSVVLDAPVASGGEVAVPKSTTIAVTIRLDRFDDLPCTLTLPDTPSPVAVTVTNVSGADLSIGGAAVTLLQTDQDSAVPVDTMQGRSSATFPIALAAGSSIELPIEADPDPTDPEASGFLWNAVLVELLDKRLDTTPAVMLAHVHEMVGGSEVSRDIVVSSPVFSTGTLPTKWAELASIEVEVTPPGSSPVTMALSLANPSETVAAAISLSAVAAGASAGITTVSYRVRNNYLDHQGQWGQPQDSSGSDLIAYPNLADGD